MLSRVSFVGLGSMGYPMASRLARQAGLLLHVHDANPATLARFLQAHPTARPAFDGPPVPTAASTTASTAAVTRRGDGEPHVVVLSLPGADEVEDAIRRSPVIASLGEGSVVVDTSTVGPACAAACSALLSQRRVRLVNAPVTGEASRAADGTLTVIASGSADAFREPFVASLLATFGSKVVWAGDRPGAAQLAKAINNAL